MLNLSDDQAEQIIRSFKIPPKPQVLVDIQLELSKPELDLVSFADVISRDFVMSAAILKTINSPAFGFNRAISDIKQSVIMLGAKYITTFATQFQLVNLLDQKASISFEKFWDTCSETANMMLLVREFVTLSSSSPKEDAYAFGMFRDCGIPLMAIKFEDYKEVLIEANSTPEIRFTDVEEKHYPTNHAIVGFLLAGTWHFPKELCQLILRHHEADFLNAADASLEQKDLFALSKIAANIHNKIKSGEEHSEWYLAHDNVLSYLHLSEIDYEHLEADVIDKYHEIYG